jgi:hypothetical protein
LNPWASVVDFFSAKSVPQTQQQRGMERDAFIGNLKAEVVNPWDLHKPTCWAAFCRSAFVPIVIIFWGS